MKKILLALLIFSSPGFAQSRFSDYRDFVERSVNQQTFPDLSKTPDFMITSSEKVEEGTNIRTVFNGEIFDRSSEGIYFMLRANYYKIFIPEIRTVYIIACNNPEKSTGDHLLWLLGEIRKYKETILTRTSY
jgi:hypothetical protein